MSKETRNTDSKGRLHIVGGGVIGLGAAVKFASQGLEVHVFADDEHYFPVSAVAAAFWSPYACSMTLEQERSLAEPTFRFIAEHVDTLESGIEFRAAVKYFGGPADEGMRRRPWWGELPVDFREFGPEEVPEHLQRGGRVGPFSGGWRFRVPVVDMTRFLPWLRRRAERLGVRFHNQRVESLAAAAAGAAAVVNCSGGWATRLTGDDRMVGYQGVVLEVPGEPFGDELLFIEEGPGAPAYIVPQRHRTVLGGTLQAKTAPGERWEPGDRRLWTASPDEAQDVWARCCGLIGREPPVVPTKAIAGLRPRRLDAPPRIELETINVERGCAAVIHNYGHGGAGVTTFWGSAQLAHGLFVGIERTVHESHE